MVVESEAVVVIVNLVVEVNEGVVVIVNWVVELNEPVDLDDENFVGEACFEGKEERLEEDVSFEEILNEAKEVDVKESRLFDLAGNHLPLLLLLLLLGVASKKRSDSQDSFAVVAIFVVDAAA